MILVGEPGQPLEVVDVALQAAEGVEPPLDAGVLGAGLGRGVGVVPEAGLAHPGLELGDARAQGIRVKGSPRAGTAARGWRPGAAGWAGMCSCRPWVTRRLAGRYRLMAVSLAHLDDRLGDALERATSRHHLRRLRRQGQLGALATASEGLWATTATAPPRDGNALEVLI